MLKLKVNDIEIEVEEGLTVLQACEIAGFEIGREEHISTFNGISVLNVKLIFTSI